MATNVHLTPELERFARGCVESGRYNNVSEVLRSALRLLQDQEERKAAFMRSLEEAQAEADRDGTYTIEQVAEELDAIIAAAEDVER
jgi:antitoxin ParD1/3/4